MINKQIVFHYIETEYGITPDFPWMKYPEYAVFRLVNNRKWFCLAMTVTRAKLGLNGDEVVEIINIKCPPEIIGSLRSSAGFLPAYHMNKEHWITILLDGTVSKDDVLFFLNQSYHLTNC
ncbi:MmcQ/YjbR family DNA-binding protein [uncultured Tolumonas sp.]|uniref:MmcQ/YjbR family DNA-binding protein n=1 Tax=uncultured Tolumonas sp. TaxID=263765 RepID=UPI00292DED0C|nr:MmcQ/YjbR family DNA-binding protein [uncultured Tolumonas sp.]